LARHRRTRERFGAGCTRRLDLRLLPPGDLMMRLSPEQVVALLEAMLVSLAQIELGAIDLEMRLQRLEQIWGLADAATVDRRTLQ